MKDIDDNTRRLKLLDIGICARFLLRRKAAACKHASLIGGRNVGYDELTTAIDMYAQMSYNSVAKHKNIKDAFKFAKGDAQTAAWDIIRAGDRKTFAALPVPQGETHTQRVLRFSVWHSERIYTEIISANQLYQETKPEGYPSVRGLTKLLAGKNLV